MDNKKWLNRFYPGEIRKFVDTIDEMCFNCPLSSEENENCDDCPIRQLIQDALEVFKSKDLRGWVDKDPIQTFLDDNDSDEIYFECMKSCDECHEENCEGCLVDLMIMEIMKRKYQPKK